MPSSRAGRRIWLFCSVLALSAIAFFAYSNNYFGTAGNQDSPQDSIKALSSDPAHSSERTNTSSSALVPPPIWKESETEVAKLAGQTPNATVWEVKETLYKKPPYFDGSAPITYTDLAAEFIPAAFAGGSGRGVLVSRFRTFENHFLYSEDGAMLKFSGIPIGARTTSTGDGQLLAEARILSKRADMAFELGEFHYDRQGKVRFHSISKIDSTGFKIEEIKHEGRKEQDFYFVWPVRLL